MIRTLASVLFIGIAAAAVAGLLECVVALIGPSTVLVPNMWWEVSANYVLLSAIFTLVVLPVLSVLMRDSVVRTWSALCIGGLVIFVPFLLLNRHVVHGNPLSSGRMLVYAGAALSAISIAHVLLKLSWHVDRLAPWGIALSLCVLASMAGLVIRDDRDPGESSAEVLSTMDRPPNVLLILVDAMRADHLSLYRYPRRTTPNLDLLAQDSLVFDQARSESSWTKPSVSTLFTGLPPLVHAQLTWRSRMPEDVTTLAEYFRGGDYRTAAFSDNPVVSPVFGFGQGFEEFRWHSGWASSAFHQGASLGRVMRHFGIPDVRSLFATRDVVRGEFGAARLGELFLDWMRSGRPEKPWFAYLHYMEPHSPYDPPGRWRKLFTDAEYPDPGSHRVLPRNYKHPWETAPPIPEEERQFLIGLYDGEIAFWDSEFGKMLAELRRTRSLENTIVIVTADHGEEFYEHGGWEHGNSLYDELLRVPLLLYGPGIPKGRCADAVSLRYVLPTLLKLTGIRPLAPPAFPLSRSLLPLPESFGPQEAAHKPGSDRDSFALLRGHMKWILSSSPEEQILECYDLSVDPGELANVADSQPAELRQSVKHDITHRRRMERAASREGPDATPSKEMRDALKGLGYVM